MVQTRPRTRSLPTSFPSFQKARTMAQVIRSSALQPVVCLTSTTPLPHAVPRQAIRINAVLLASPGNVCRGLRPRTCLTRTQVRRNSLVVAAALNAGGVLPSIPSLETDEAPKSLSLSDVVKESGVVLFIYPKADTSGCTKQACGFNDNMEKFQSAGYKIFGLSADEPAAQAAWKKKEGYRYNLLSDPSHEVLKALGVSDGSSIKRSHFIVEKGGTLKDVRYGISSGDSVPEALKAIGAAAPAAADKPTFGSVI